MSTKGPQARELDVFDLRILQLLVQDPRRSQRSLAKEIGLSAPAIAERISQLEASGIITGYTATIDLAKLGRSLTVFVGISCELGSDHLERSKSLAEIDEVESVVLTTGDFDLLLKINVSDREHLNEVLFHKLIEGPTKITQSHSMLNLQEFVQEDHVLRLLSRMLEQNREKQLDKKPSTQDQD